jgi:hypothetical protein
MLIMFKNLVLSLLCCSIPVFSGAGSGVVLKIGVEKPGYHTTDKNYKIATTNLYSFYPVEGQAPVLPTYSLGYSLSLSRALSVSAGVGFLTVGDDFKANLVTTDINQYWEIDEKIRSYYLTIPVEQQAMIPIKNGGLYASFNLQPGFLLSSTKTKHNTEPGGRVSDTVINMRDVPGNDINSFNFSLGFRGGGEIGVGKHTLYIESGYDFGLTNFETAIFDGNKVGIRTGVLTLLCVGFRFNTSGAFRK